MKSQLLKSRQLSELLIFFWPEQLTKTSLPKFLAVMQFGWWFSRSLLPSFLWACKRLRKIKNLENRLFCLTILWLALLLYLAFSIIRYSRNIQKSDGVTVRGLFFRTITRCDKSNLWFLNVDIVTKTNPAFFALYIPIGSQQNFSAKIYITLH